jgi:2-succinyl-6-hydroxy-2,4-cyclohexadiene-1-carboxylate synthase
MGLHAEHRGSGPPIVLLHGFTQTGRCWGPVADDLARDHEVITLDAPGHGGSGDIRADLSTTAGLALDATSDTGPAVWLGYSMGARLALHVALAAPEAVRGLALVGGTAGVESARLRDERRVEDAQRAAVLRAEGVDAFLARWLALPMFAGLPDWARFDDERRRNTAEGLASSLELAGTGAQDDLWPRLAELTAAATPVLALAGAEDAKFAKLAERMVAIIGPAATARTIPGAGHAAHLERPATVVTVLRSWLHTLPEPAGDA